MMKNDEIEKRLKHVELEIKKTNKQVEKLLSELLKFKKEIKEGVAFNRACLEILIAAQEDQDED